MSAYILSGAVRLANTTTTQGNLLTINATGDLAPVATGTAGQILTSSGAGSQPLFQDPLGLASGVTGYIVKTGSTSFVGRTFAAGSGISLTNADGVAGNTTISVTGIPIRGFFVHKSGTQSITQNTFNTITNWTTSPAVGTAYNIGGDFNTTTGVFTVPTTGFYYVSARGVWALTNQNVIRMLVVRRLTPSTTNCLASLLPVDSTTSLVCSIENILSGILSMTAGETYALTANCQTAASTLNAVDTVTSGAPNSTGIGTYFNIIFLGS